jgi:CO/xanthine dehydrogenase FAD-binding subunit
MLHGYVVVWRWPSGRELRLGPAWRWTERAADRRLRGWRRRLQRHARRIGSQQLDLDLRVERLVIF